MSDKGRARLWRLLLALYRPLGHVVYRHRTSGSVPGEGGLILVANHATMADGPWLASIAGRPVAFMANRRLFKKRIVGPLLRLLGAFPKRKFEPDVKAVLQTLRHCRAGTAVGIFPEGVRTWDGQPASLHPGLGELIRRAGVPVVAVRILTGHMQSPQWARVRRWVPIVAEVSEPHAFPAGTSPEAIERKVAALLAIDPAALPTPRGAIGVGLALGLRDYLWACPACDAHGTLRPYGLLRSRIGCPDCGAEWRLRINLDLEAMNDRCGSMHLSEAARRLAERALPGAATPRIYPLTGIAWEGAGESGGRRSIPAHLALCEAVACIRSATGESLDLPLRALETCFLQGDELRLIGNGRRWTLHCGAPDRIMLWKLLEAARKRESSAAPA